MEQLALDVELQRRDSPQPIGAFYGELRKAGLEYGANFATVREVWLGQPGSGEAIGRVAVLTSREKDRSAFTNTVLLDGCLQVFGASFKTAESNGHRGPFIPASIQSIILRRELPPQVWSHVQIRTNGDGRAAVAHVRILTDDGELVAEIDNMELRHKASLAPAGSRSVPITSVRDTAADGSTGQPWAQRAQLIERLRPLPKDARLEVLTGWLISEVKDTMGQAADDLDLDNIDPSTAFLEIGLDSLLVTELQRRIQERLDFRFQPMQGLDYQSIESLADYILTEALVLEPLAAAEPTPIG
jgi:acyl carrier protein